MGKQTAVEWLEEKLKGNTIFSLDVVLNKAKAMEREQIVTAYCSDRYPCSEEDGEQYFTETYGKE